MVINVDKTKVLHVRKQDPTTPTTSHEASKVCKFKCPHLNCGFKFLTMHGMKVHAGSCKWKNEFVVEAIVDHRGPVISRQYKIRWKGFSSDYDTFEPRGNIHPDLIREYELDNDVYAHGWKFRCDICDLPCSSKRGVNIHKSKSYKPEKAQIFKGRLADEAVQY